MSVMRQSSFSPTQILLCLEIALVGNASVRSLSLICYTLPLGYAVLPEPLNPRLLFREACSLYPDAVSLPTLSPPGAGGNYAGL